MLSLRSRKLLSGSPTIHHQPMAILPDKAVDVDASTRGSQCLRRQRIRAARLATAEHAGCVMEFEVLASIVPLDPARNAPVPPSPTWICTRLCPVPYAPSPVPCAGRAV